MNPSADKEIFFLCGPPRAGNTLLGSIINQNPDFCVTANSICADMMGALFNLKQHEIFRNFPDHDSFNNVAHNVLDLYYRDWPQRYILDRAPWGRSDYLTFLKESRRRPIKMIVLTRDIVDVLASLIDFSRRQPDSYLNKFWANSIEEKCDLLMVEGGLISMELEAIRNMMKPENAGLSLFVDYDDLVVRPREVVTGIYEFLGIPHFEHRFDRLEQFAVNNMRYDDSFMGDGLHRVKTDSIEKTRRRAEDVLPAAVIAKYGQLDFWKNR